MRGWGLYAKASNIEKKLSSMGVISHDGSLDFSDWTSEELKELIHSIDHTGKIPNKYKKRLEIVN